MRMRRKDALAAIKVAGYHDDKQTGTRLYIENRVSLQTYNREFDAGRKARQNGVPCNCFECKAKREEACASS